VCRFIYLSANKRWLLFNYGKRPKHAQDKDFKPLIKKKTTVLEKNENLGNVLAKNYLVIISAIETTNS